MNPYIKFLSESANVRKPEESTARELLDLICLNAGLGKPLTVTKAMLSGSLASPATLHRKLDILLADGFVTHEYQGKNRRTKYLVPTKKSEDYLAAMTQAMTRGLKP